MKALRTSANTQTEWLTRTALAKRDSTKNEDWLQDLLFQHSDLIPIQTVNPGSSSFVPICRELTIPKQGGSVFLDIFGVTPEGKLVLVECKLWRNPQARREVIAQILEYAALLRQWSYGDLTARLKKQLKTDSANPLYDTLRPSEALPDEAAFVDNVTASLVKGDFILIIAGDGIRSDVQAITDHLNQHTGTAAQLALVEFQLWEDASGDLCIIPWVPLRTDVIQQRVVVSEDGTPLALATDTGVDDSTEAIIDPERSAQRQTDRAFWQAFIDEVTFDHPDQPKPRHAGPGWVRMDMPPPASWMTAYKTRAGGAGIFLPLKKEDGRTLFDDLQQAQSHLETEVGQPLRFAIKSDDPFDASVNIDYPGPAEDLSEWLKTTANHAVSSLRVFLSQYQD